MNTYGFTAHVLGLDMDSDDQLERISILDFDASAETRDGNEMIAVSIDAANPTFAIRQGIVGLESCGLQLLRFDMDLVNLTEIGFRTGNSRETARLWATGKRRAGFPTPHTSVSNSSLWAWSDVYDWLHRNNIAIDDLFFETPLPKDLIERYNGNFARRRQADSAWGTPSQKVVSHRDWAPRPALRRIDSPWSEPRIAVGAR